jgi:hypothetical protein
MQASATDVSLVRAAINSAPPNACHPADTPQQTAVCGNRRDAGGFFGARLLLPLPATEEWREDRAEGPPLPGPPPLLGRRGEFCCGCAERILAPPPPSTVEAGAPISRSARKGTCCRPGRTGVRRSGGIKMRPAAQPCEQSCGRRGWQLIRLRACDRQTFSRSARNLPSSGMMDAKILCASKRCGVAALARAAREKRTSWATFTKTRTNRSHRRRYNCGASRMLAATPFSQSGATATRAGFFPSTTSGKSLMRKRRSSATAE